MLFFVFTVDGDWEGYYDSTLSEEKRKPNARRMLSWFDDEIQLAAKVLNGRFLHFIHTSPRVRDFFLQAEFISRWKEIEIKGGSIGIHCHEDDPRRAYFYDNQEKMEKAIGFLAEGLSEKGLQPMAYRGGYLAFSPKIIPILEENAIFLDFSCKPGRYLFHEGLLVSDWRGAPNNFYRMSYADHRKPGNSNLFEIPLGIYIEKDSLRRIWRKAKELKKREGKVIVSVLAHSYEFGSFARRLKIKLALLILRKYGKFVNAREILDLVKGEDKL